MRTDVSIPDPLFQSAEILAEQLQLSRDDLYSQAVERFVQSHRSEFVTQRLNKIYDGQSSAIPEDMQRVQLGLLEDEGW